MNVTIRMLVLSLAIIQLALFASVEGNMRVKISCNINSVNWIVIGNLKTCQNEHTHSVSEPSHSESLEIEINREKGYYYRPTSIYEIKGLSIENLPMKTLPKGLKQKLPKLRAIDVKSCGLTSLNQDDMMPFGRDLISAAFWCVIKTLKLTHTHLYIIFTPGTTHSHHWTQTYLNIIPTWSSLHLMEIPWNSSSQDFSRILLSWCHYSR